MEEGDRERGKGEMGETRRHEFRYYVAVYFFFGVFTPPIIRGGGLVPPKKSYPRAFEELKLSNKMNAESGEKLWLFCGYIWMRKR